jgi:hypothetical protein
LARYERVTFDKQLINLPDKPGPADFVSPGHPLLEAVIDLILERHRDVLKQGAILVDPGSSARMEPRVLYYLEHAVQDARTTADGSRRIVSRRMQFAEVNEAGEVRDAGWAPYLDYRPVTPEERQRLEALLAQTWLTDGAGLEAKSLAHAAEHLVPRHLREVRDRREVLIEKTKAAVRARLLAEINYWDHRANQLKDQELAGKVNARLNSGKARQRAEELQARLDKRLAELEKERHLSAQPPLIIGGALVVPSALLMAIPDVDEDGLTTDQRKQIDSLAMAKVLETERRLGREPRAMPHENPGYDIESRAADGGQLLFVEVKGKVVGKPTVTISRNQITTAQNVGENFILAIVLVEGGVAQEPVYVRGRFTQPVDFAVTSVNFKLTELLSRGGAPA